MSIPVVTTAAGLVYLEPKQPVQTRHHVRTSNGVIEVRPGVRFDIVLANFSKTTQLLPKGMTIAYAKRNPLAILTIPKNVSTKLEAVLNLPFTTAKNEDNSKNEADPNEETNTKERNTNWRDTINLEHVDDHDLRTRILTMLTKHEDMWTSGRLGEIAATEHRIELTDAIMRGCVDPREKSDIVPGFVRISETGTGLYILPWWRCPYVRAPANQRYVNMVGVPRRVEWCRYGRSSLLFPRFWSCRNSGDS